MKFVVNYVYISQMIVRFQIIFFICGVDYVVVLDFSGGVMENWGFVFYCEIVLFYEFGVLFSENKLMVMLIIVYEVVYMVRNECNYQLNCCLYLINGIFFVFLFFVLVMG